MLHVGVHGLRAMLQKKGIDTGYWWQLTVFNASLPAESKKFLTDKGVELVQLETYDQELRKEPSR